MWVPVCACLHLGSSLFGALGLLQSRLQWPSFATCLLLVSLVFSPARCRAILYEPAIVFFLSYFEALPTAMPSGVGVSKKASSHKAFSEKDVRLGVH